MVDVLSTGTVVADSVAVGGSASAFIVTTAVDFIGVFLIAGDDDVSVFVVVDFTVGTTVAIFMLPGFVLLSSWV